MCNNFYTLQTYKVQYPHNGGLEDEQPSEDFLQLRAYLQQA